MTLSGLISPMRLITTTPVNQSARFRDEFYTALELIEENPYLYQIINSAKHRRCLLKSYLYSVFYRITTTSQTIDVLALAHQAKKPYFL